MGPFGAKYMIRFAKEDQKGEEKEGHQHVFMAINDGLNEDTEAAHATVDTQTESHYFPDASDGVYGGHYALVEEEVFVLDENAVQMIREPVKFITLKMFIHHDLIDATVTVSSLQERIARNICFIVS